MDEVQPALVRSTLFRGVAASLVSSVAAASESRLMSRGERLILAGSANDRLHVIVSGTVVVRVPGSDDEYVRLGAGDCVGELSIIDGRPATADVVAEESTVVLSIARDQLWAAIDSSAELARNLLRVLAGRVRYDDSVLAETSRLTRYFERLATVDGLTGLRNRRWLDDAFSRQLERSLRAGEPVSVLMIDIDRFKVLNDRFGHLMGDAVLCRVARVLVQSLRPQDLLARYGGEEFAVLLPNVDATAAMPVAERLRQAVAAPEAEEGHQPLPTVTISVGIAAVQAKETLTMLVSRADAALYRAKQSGRNRSSI
jgi:diguanylate cyclase (GGDEF)-like protein